MDQGTKGRSDLPVDGELSEADIVQFRKAAPERLTLNALVRQGARQIQPRGGCRRYFFFQASNIRGGSLPSSGFDSRAPELGMVSPATGDLRPRQG